MSSRIEVGGAAETVTVKGEAPVIQAASGERSFTIPTESVQNLPIANRSFLQLAQLAPGVVMNGTQVQRLGTIVQSTNVMMDGVSTMDTGSNGAIVQMNTESIAEVKVLVSGYQAEYGRSSGLQIMAVTKSGTNRFRGSVYDVEPQLRLERQQQDQHPQRHPEADPEAAGLGLLDRRPDREAGRQQQAVLLPCARVPAAHRRQRRRVLPDADRARAARRLLADARQPRQPVSLHQGSATDAAPAPRPTRRRASGTAACSARIPATVSTSRA